MIVKNLLAVGVIVSTATVASAADEAKANRKVNGVLRMDALQTSTEVKAGSADKTTAKTSGIYPNRAAFTLTGETANDTMVIEYFLSDVVPGTASATLNRVNNAYVHHKFTDMISVMGGQIDTLAQSWENDYDTVDGYLFSAAHGLAPASTTGYQVNANFGDHKVALQLLQGLRSTGSGTTAESFNEGGGLTAALQYRGEINKMIRPIVSYTNVKTSGSSITVGGVKDANYKRENAYQTQLGLGVQVDTAGLIADIEYDSVTTLKKKWAGSGSEPTASAATNKDSTTTSLVLQAKYAIGATSPFLKFVSDATKNGLDSGLTDMTATKFGLGVEHKLDSTCRLHAVYTSQASTTKLSASDNLKATSTGFNFGVTAAM